MEHHLKLRHDAGIIATYTVSKVGGIPYIYLSATRSDFSQTIHVLSQFVSAPTSVRYVAFFRVLRYLHSTISRSLLYSSDSSFSLRAYSDAGGSMIRTHAAPPEASAFFWVPLSFLGGASVRMCVPVQHRGQISCYG